jgi:nitrogen PTS system EIIA component
MRTKNEGDLLCAVGWSPEGIEYGAADGGKVHLVIMYYIPDSQRNSYLKEISGLARAIADAGDIRSIYDLADLPDVRNKLLDWVEIAIHKPVPDSKARMIKIEERQAASALKEESEPGASKTRWSVIPFSLLALEPGKCVVLSQSREILDALEPIENLHRWFLGSRSFELAGYQINVLSSSGYSGNRTLFECVAVKGAG